MLDIQNISKTFEKGTVNEHVAINNLSLKLEDGEFVTVVGSNGAGKKVLCLIFKSKDDRTCFSGSNEGNSS